MTSCILSHVRGPLGTLLPARARLPPHGHGNRPQRLRTRPRAMACVRRGGSVALRWLGLPVRWLACWGRWMSKPVVAHYGDAPDDFVVADNVELPWPGAQGDMEWEWRVVSLKDIFLGELLALCVHNKDVGPEEDLGGWRGGDADTESRAGRNQRGDRPEHAPAC